MTGRLDLSLSTLDTHVVYFHSWLLPSPTVVVEACVKNSVGGGACMAGGACLVVGVCMVGGGMRGGGACMTGLVGMYGGGGHAWQERRPLQHTVRILL